MPRNLLVIAVMGALLLPAACGGGDDSSQSTTPALQTGATAAPPSAPSSERRAGREKKDTERAERTGTGGVPAIAGKTGAEPPSPGRTSSPDGGSSAPASKRKPKLTPAQRRAAKKFFEANAHTACKTFGLAGTAQLARTNSRDPREVAAVYADRFVERSPEWARRPTYRGCLAGLRAAGK